MATMDEILAALNAGNETISKQNPYTGLTSTADQIGNLIVKSAKPGDLKEAALASAITGLVGGTLGQIGTNYELGKRQDYQSALLDMIAGNQVDQGDLSSGLYKQAQTEANTFKLLQDVKQDDEQRAIKNALLGNAAQVAVQNNPRAAKSVLEKLLEVKIDSPTPMALPADAGKDSEVSNFQSEYNMLLESGVSPAQAAQTARANMNARLKEAGEEKKNLQKEQIETYKKIDEAAQQGEALSRMVDQLDYYTQEAGNTGIGGGLRQWGSSLLGELGVESQQKKAAAGEQIKSLGADIVRTARQVGSGPMSDRDVQLYLSSGPQLTNTEEANQEIINRMRYAAKLQSSYADFMREQRDAGVPLVKAQQAWRETVKANPYLVKNGDKFVQNDSWLSGLGNTEPTKATESTRTIINKTGKDGKVYQVYDLGNGKYELVE